MDGITFLDPACALDVEAVAGLHERFLGDSPVARMGPLFIRRFYYRKLVEPGSIRCLVCRVDGRVVGFLSYTRYPNTFMGTGVRRYWAALAWSLVATALRYPKALAEVAFVVKLMAQRRSDSQLEEHGDDTAEALSMAVEPQHEKYVPAGGKSRMSVRFFEEMVRELRADGIKTVRFMVRPENKAANFYYHMLGCSITKVEHAGVAVHRFEYTIPETP